jgi:hypothetical protein
VEKHIVASIRQRIINTFAESNSYYPPDIVAESHQYETYVPPNEFWPGKHRDPALPASGAPQGESDFDLGRLCREVGERETGESETSARERGSPVRRRARHPTSLVSAFTSNFAGVTMSDASPSKRRKTKGTPMKTKKSYGKEFGTSFGVLTFLFRSG